MGASQKQCFRPDLPHRLQIARNRIPQQRVLRINMPAFDQRYKIRAGNRDDLPPWTGLLQRLLITAAADACLRRDHGDRSLSLQAPHPVCRRIQHADRRNRPGLQEVPAVGGHRSAGNQDGLHVMGRNERVILLRHTAQLIQGLFPIGHTAAVRKINDVFIRQKAAQRTQRCQAAEAGIKDADRS